MRALAQGAAQAAEIIAAIRAGVDLLLCAAGPRRASGGSRRRCVAAAADGRFDPADARGVAGARSTRLRRWLGAAGPAAGPRRSSAAPSTRGARARAGGAVADARPRRRAAAAPPPARRRHDPRRHADADRPDPGRHVVDGRARARPRRCGRGSAGSRRSSCRAAPTDAEIAAVRERARDASTPSSSGRSTAHASRARPRSSRRVAAAPATPDRRGRAADAVGRRDVPGRRRRRSAPTRSCPARSTALAARSSGAIPVRRPAPGPGRSASRRQPAAMTLRDEILEQPAVARPVPRRRRPPPSTRSPPRSATAATIEHVVIAARGTSDHAAIYAQYVLGIRHGLTVGLATPSVVSLYGADPRLRARARRRRSASRAPRRTSSRSSRRPGARAPRPSRSPTTRARRWPAAADWTIDLVGRPGTGDRRDQDLHRRRSSRSPRCRRRSTDDPADRARASRHDPGRARRDARARGRRWRRIAEAHAAADRALVIARGYEYATAREWAIKIKELAHVFADPYSAADFQHGPVALVEPGVPVIAVVRDGPTAAGLIELLGRLRDDLDADADGRLGRAGGAGRRPAWPRRAAARGRRVARRRSRPIVAGQLHALHLTRARGLDPDAPRSIQQGDAHALTPVPVPARPEHPNRRRRRTRPYRRRSRMVRGQPPGLGSTLCRANLGHEERTDATTSEVAAPARSGRGHGRHRAADRLPRPDHRPRPVAASPTSRRASPSRRSPGSSSTPSSPMTSARSTPSRSRIDIKHRASRFMRRLRPRRPAGPPRLVRRRRLHGPRLRDPRRPPGRHRGHAQLARLDGRRPGRRPPAAQPDRAGMSDDLDPDPPAEPADGVRRTPRRRLDAGDRPRARRRDAADAGAGADAARRRARDAWPRRARPVGRRDRRPRDRGRAGRPAASAEAAIPHRARGESADDRRRRRRPPTPPPRSASGAGSRASACSCCAVRRFAVDAVRPGGRRRARGGAVYQRTQPPPIAGRRRRRPAASRPRPSSRS